MTKARASKTINPLHFEDLEPHRFEDLIRQLAYGFRPWTRLEATGRLGGDEGTDIRGLEVVSAGDNSDVEMVDGADDPQAETVLAEREWRIQCKRYKTISPKLMRSIVAETVPDPEYPPHGLIVAAACDVSAQTLAAFHEARIKLGVREGYLWTKAHLEDLIFRPDNDHLLFAYFGISLGARRRSRIQNVRNMLSIKRKILRTLRKESLDQLYMDEVFLRDVEDTTYPGQKYDLNAHPLTLMPWFVASITGTYSRGLVISQYSLEGWMKENGEWDLLPESAYAKGPLGESFIYSYVNQEERSRRVEERQVMDKLFRHLSEDEKISIHLDCYLPYDSIAEVDSIGDKFLSCPHIFCIFSGEDGPFEARKLLAYYRGKEILLEQGKRVHLLPEFASKILSDEEYRLLRSLCERGRGSRRSRTPA